MSEKEVAAMPQGKERDEAKKEQVKMKYVFNIYIEGTDASNFSKYVCVGRPSYATCSK